VGWLNVQITWNWQEKPQLGRNGKLGGANYRPIGKGARRKKRKGSGPLKKGSAVCSI